MIVYTNKCLCQSRDKQRLRELGTQYAEVEVRRVAYRKEWQEEAAKFNKPMPFIVERSAAFDFYTGNVL